MTQFSKTVLKIVHKHNYDPASLAQTPSSVLFHPPQTSKDAVATPADQWT